MKRSGRDVKVPVSGQYSYLAEIEYATEAVRSNNWAYGEYNEMFSKRLREFVGTRYAVLCNSGSSADLLAMSALKSGVFDKEVWQMRYGYYVLTTALAFPTTINAAVQNGYIPIFVDSDLETLNVIPEQAEEAHWKFKDWKPIINLFTHTLGNPFDVDRIQSIDKNTILIEDNCDGLGSIYKGKKTGSLGFASTLSFYPAHHITTGEGGAVLTQSPAMKKALDSYCSWGKDCWCDPGFDNTCGKRFGHQLGKLPAGYDHKYTFSEIGYNLKMTNIQAALGAAQMTRIETFGKMRRYNWNFLYDALKEFEDFFIFQRSIENADPSWFGFAITLRNENCPFTKNEIVQYLEDAGVATRPIFAGNITKHPAYRKVRYEVYGDLRNTDYIMNNSFWIGCWPGLDIHQLEYAVDIVRNYIKTV